MFSNFVVFKAQTAFDFQWTVYSTWESLIKFTALKIFVKKNMRKNDDVVKPKAYLLFLE